MSDLDPTRIRLARALGAFWDGGAGPSHSALTGVLSSFGLDGVEPRAASKRERVEAAVRHADDGRLKLLVEELVHVLADHGTFETGPDAAAAPRPGVVARAQRELASAGFHLSDDGQLRAGSPLPVDLTTLQSAREIREHLDRIQRAVDTDPPLVVGSCKELIEATCKLVLAQLGQDPGRNPKMPALIKQAQEALGLHQSTLSRSPETEPVVRILGSLSQIALNVNELRQTSGTGHGRVGGNYRLLPRHARLVAGATTTYCTLLLDTLADPDAPWRDGGPP